MTNEQLEVKIAELEKRLDERCRGCRELSKAELKARDVALELQEKETDRRLTNLNHENERVSQWRTDCVPKVAYDIQHKALSDKVEITTNWMNGQIGRQTIVSVMLPLGVSFVVSLLFLLLNYFLSH
jgi:hypothetical protein